MYLDEIIHGDSAEVLKTFPPECIDLTVTSPPYDNLRKYNGYHFDFPTIARELYRVTKVGGVVVWVVGDATINGSETGTSFRQALYFKEIGFNLHDTMIYRKNNRPPLNHPRYEQEFEYMFVFSKGKPSRVNLLTTPCIHAGKKNTGTARNNGSDVLSKKHGYGKPCKPIKTIGNVWSYSVGVEKDNKGRHPAVFPEALARDHITSWSNEGDIVLDCFSGSGTTPKMAKLLNRHYIGIDTSIKYVELSRKRLGA